jgi:RNA polymerase sigma factor (sigma-70 family)
MSPQLRTVLGQLHRLARGGQAGGLADGDLLGRYTGWRDEAAFEALVWRHGAMVLGVCRRVLGNEADTDDAFQATFLALAKGAGSITRRESVGGWLYRVALRIARKARSARRPTSQLPDVAGPAPDPAEMAADRDLRIALDEEVARLPGKLRVPFVLCYLEGRTNAQAARELGCAEGTVASRLAGARHRLRSRLSRRGLTVTGGLVAACLGREALAVPAQPALVLGTVRAALAFGAGKAPAEGLVSGCVVTLARGALQAMLYDRLRAGAVWLAVVGLAAVLAVTAGHHLLAGVAGAGKGLSQQRASEGPRQPDPPRDKPAPGRLLFYRAGHLTLISPDGKEVKQVSKNRAKYHPGEGFLSPDGKRVAYLVQVEEAPAPGRDPRRKVYVRGLHEPEPGTDLGVEAQWITWSPDGKQLVAADFVHADDPKGLKFANWLVDLKTGEKTALKLPHNQMVLDWSRDGKHFLTQSVELGKEFPPKSSLHLVSRDGTEDRMVTAEGQSAFYGRLSPDGRKVLCLALDPERKGHGKEDRLGLFVLDVGKRKLLRVEEQPLNGTFMGFCWSPDGRCIAYAWRQDVGPRAQGQQVESHLVVADADGRHPITIATERGDSRGLITIGCADWR